MKKSQPTVHLMVLYAKKYGFNLHNGISPYEICAKALRRNGYLRDVSDKKLCHQFWDVVADSKLKTSATKVKKDVNPQNSQYIKIDVNSNDFLQSYEWRKLRLIALEMHGRKCLCCGASPATGAVMHVDHIKPRKLYPELALDINNLQVLCAECNHGKGNWCETDFRTASPHGLYMPNCLTINTQ